MPNGKAVGPDGIPVEALKNSPSYPLETQLALQEGSQWSLEEP